MFLLSTQFKGDQKLEACLIKDPAHITQGSRGEHVSKIQVALLLVDGANIVRQETSARLYGTSTAEAVLAYKTKRRIINTTYQTKPDNIVGKMTMAALDREMLQFERGLRERNSCSGRKNNPVRG